MTNEIARLRADFAREMGKSLSMPIAGALAWAVAGIGAMFFDERPATYLLLFAVGSIFPLALLIGRHLDENLLSRANPLARLMGMSVLMVNLLWALHITLLLRDSNTSHSVLASAWGCTGSSSHGSEDTTWESSTPSYGPRW